MKVHYDSSMWGKGNGFCGLPQRTNWKFEYMGTKRFIPVIYRFSKGVVFDVITILDEVKLHDFFEKYEAIEDALTSLQRRCAKQEHPYQPVNIKEIWINGKQVECGWSSSSAVSIPWARQEDVLSRVRKACCSILGDITCFACERFCVPYSETNSKTEKLLRFFRLDKVNSLKLSTYPVQRLSPLNIKFEMLPDEKEKKISFQHPMTDAEHTLYFQNAQSVELPFGEDGNRKFYVKQAMYEIEPSLPQGDTLQFSSSMQYTEIPEDKFSPNCAASIGIIGGAHGPTAIFFSTRDKKNTIPCGSHGLPIYSCFSVPGFQKDDASRFILEGININICDSKVFFFA